MTPNINIDMCEERAICTILNAGSPRRRGGSDLLSAAQSPPASGVRAMPCYGLNPKYAIALFFV